MARVGIIILVEVSMDVQCSHLYSVVILLIHSLQAETVRKLLEKQCTKRKDEEKVLLFCFCCCYHHTYLFVVQPRVQKKAGVPHITYVSKQDKEGRVGSTLSLPHGMEFPMMAKKYVIQHHENTLAAWRLSCLLYRIAQVPTLKKPWH